MKPEEFLICLDAGHGGLLPGTPQPALYTTFPSKCFEHRTGNYHARGWFFEGVYNRDVALYLRQYLIDYGFNVKNVFDPIKDTPLSTRCQLANNYAKGYKASIYVSIHGNAGPSTARGFEIFTTKGKTKSDTLATGIFNEVNKMVRGWPMRADYSDNDPDKEEDFGVLRMSKMPAVLSENGFFTNRDDAVMMMTREFQRNIALAHAMGILEYAKNIGVVYE